MAIPVGLQKAYSGSASAHGNRLIINSDPARPKN